jgi:hypothetical protein
MPIIKHKLLARELVCLPTPNAQGERNQIFPFGHLQSPQSCAKRDQEEADHNVAGLPFKEFGDSLHDYLNR